MHTHLSTEEYLWKEDFALAWQKEVNKEKKSEQNIKIKQIKIKNQIETLNMTGFL